MRPSIIDVPTPEAVARAIGLPVRRWEGNCYGVASACVERGVVDGMVVYGVWWGLISDRSKFAGRQFTHHAWVRTTDGLIFDPTQWCFEATRPYIYVGIEGHDYDHAGIRLRSECRRQLPPPMGKDVVLRGLTKQLVAAVAATIPDARIVGRTVCVSASQLCWFANTDPRILPDYPKFVAAMSVAGLQGFIPIDYRQIYAPAKEGAR